MASGGMGDVLAGIIGALSARFPLDKAVTLGTLWHSCTADFALSKRTQISLKASDLIQFL